jgi:SH3 domain protein
MRGKIYLYSTNKPRPTVFFAVFFILNLLLSSTVLAEKPYFVAPSTEIPVRRGIGERYRIIKLVQSDTPVTLLEEKEGWARVRFSDGVEGWMLKRMLTDDIPPSKKLESLKKESSGFLQEKERFAQDIENLNMELHGYRLQLQEETDKLTACMSEQNTIRAERRAMEDTAAVLWFLSGAGVFLIGWILGRVAPGTRRRRSSLM